MSDNEDKDFDTRLVAAIAVMKTAGIPDARAWPASHRLMRRLGLRPRPPLFAAFWSNACFYGLPAGGMWGLIMWMWIWRGQGMPVIGAVLAAGLFALLFGCAMAWLARRSARALDLPGWETL